jgi:hypothetical protein
MPSLKNGNLNKKFCTSAIFHDAYKINQLKPIHSLKRIINEKLSMQTNVKSK